MSELKWLSRKAIEIMHHEQLAEHGGLAGLKDENALEAALARPLHKAAYGEDDIFALAAAYLYGLTRNHPFSDGNKRTGFLAAFTFLYINGHLIEAEEVMVIEFVLGVAAGEIDEDGATRFLRDMSVPLPK
ncbi:MULTISPECIES: type II toxin-antitoxin system death-on-curing family toxin [unclassified Rhizobium]|uniref:type II toxin-antitoxin system death-on-curing family toxin n=1 Tax=unclassified Rhizobium TaxID=2613769 RepID=UPI001ADA6857|nr:MULTISPECIES: type II toxin-antitoxin system death-on-curing family toxin [unclassified Rhizobium]MBO9098003.1 type II toxin-antitoxin system death-on-curing family toxin [Rhizobium sp. L58/93]MBO9168154.1 type II toxin-antitoxin system death-on-curing family toxin [Rhizobium sp. L245/93]MBO9184199.1 type II toxin-antitoxin system death-on-curing family toxin [Rhizobium sp. E27B/91]MBO9133214.1 type II toxin-antitoxin system death-on-curing family toxin [Rhizobium sp. B209b/85]QXZ84406.1 ty